jgi:RNA polymerase sigma-70 factor (ECF subfamily)
MDSDCADIYHRVAQADITQGMASRDPSVPARPQFTSTHWSAVLEAAHLSSPGSKRALETLCSHYWYPVYVFVRRRGYNSHDAQDLVQGFFSRIGDTSGSI